jgi:hypothetical protein
MASITTKSKAGISKTYNVHTALICWHSKMLEKGTFYCPILFGTLYLDLLGYKLKYSSFERTIR